MAHIIWLTLMSVLGGTVSLAAGAWWLNSVAIGSVLTAAEWFTPLRSGPISRCFCTIALVWILFSTATAYIILIAFHLVVAVLAAFLRETVASTTSTVRL